jgi:heme exporter protein A
VGLLQLEAKGVSKTFEDRPVLRDVSFLLREGECLAVSGPNGSGKSTLLKILAGLLEPSPGEVVLEGDGGRVEGEPRRRAISLVSPEIVFYEEFTPRENLEILSAIAGIDADPARIEGTIERVGLGGREDDPVRTFSSGMKQRLKFALALQRGSPVLLLDEPTSYLDTDGVAIFESILAGHRRGGIAVLATNDPGELRHGDRHLRLGR